MAQIKLFTKHEKNFRRSVSSFTTVLLLYFNQLFLFFKIQNNGIRIVSNDYVSVTIANVRTENQK